MAFSWHVKNRNGFRAEEPGRVQPKNSPGTGLDWLEANLRFRISEAVQGPEDWRPHVRAKRPWQAEAGPFFNVPNGDRAPESYEVTGSHFLLPRWSAWKRACGGIKQRQNAP